MTCIRTGAQVYLDHYGEYAYGDAFLVDRVYVFRFCERSFKPIIGPLKHFTVFNHDLWFDDAKTSQAHNSTMIAGPRDVAGHGYEGIAIEAARAA